ncbi:hypothetical protein DTO013E5_9936 [Penicillium roqueforti]|uniref:uncharacterized protein n=1 Tax=Penicillium roqueforti TaxID=5082 RepID=UPI00190BCE26|nr:uncharacterized protein LCP9604111_9652 [Penicillium roqueforti]KAF9237804.1 hypothetical protein LCP9604111_9652 [Penicillium roqueforti]KAI1829316.1 hypothetical protein CBS147337_9875 [Penicillium roqueforti]KAI2676108.1 hypothetical protein CBS147355_6289 [Penicillium roqueforti]KAI2684178.1 hypothetical protein LCP963914a_5478 [Penicillium roqueforti]KAI2694646.1 hypothetical protein CBS147372_9676 [Penicillium roqueforti]
MEDLSLAEIPRSSFFPLWVSDIEVLRQLTSVLQRGDIPGISVASNKQAAIPSDSYFPAAILCPGNQHRTASNCRRSSCLTIPYSVR